MERELSMSRLTNKGKDDPGEAANNIGEGQHNVVEVPHHWRPHCCLHSQQKVSLGNSSNNNQNAVLAEKHQVHATQVNWVTLNMLCR